MKKSEMPKNVQRFAWLWILSAALALPQLLLIPAPSKKDLEIGLSGRAELLSGLAAIIVVFAVMLPFFWLAVWRRKNWARWLLLAVFLISLLFNFLYLPALRAYEPPMNIFGWLSTACEALAFLFVFTGDARSWFESD